MSRQHFSVSLVSRVDASRRIDFGDGGWYVRMVEGWDDLPDRKGSPQPLALTHGSSSLDNTRRASASGSLVVRFRGSAEAVAEENAKLLALCAEPLQLWVTDHDGVARGRDVVVESIPVRNRHLPDTMVTASITWTAADPRRYERVKQLTAGKPMTNTGTAPTSPLLRVEGPAKAPVTVTERPTGRVVSWAGSLGTGQTLTIDPAAGVALLDGKVTMGLRSMQWPVVPPGQDRLYVSSGGKLSGEFRSAWW